MENDQQIKIIVSANSTIGFGHLKRSLVLADEFRNNGIEVQFVLFSTPLQIVTANIKNYHYQLFDSQDELVNFVLSLPASFFIIDSDSTYFSSQAFNASLAQKQSRSLIVTINNKIKHYNDVLFNQNLMSLYQDFQTQETCELILGPQYFIFDKRVRAIKPPIKAETREKKKILITFGSSDPSDNTIKVLTSLENYLTQFEQVIVVIGGMYKNTESLLQHPFILNNKEKVAVHINTNEMYQLMEEADIAITSMGLTYWELVLHKVPCMVVSSTPREKTQIGFFCEHQYAHYLGDFNDENWENKWKLNVEKYQDDLKIDDLYNKINVNGVELLVKRIMDVIQRS